MKRQTTIELAVFSALVALGVGVRVYFHYYENWPNFAPVAALALFAGYYFRSWVVALALLLTVMGASDYFIGGYDPRVMVTVYGLLALPVVLRSVLRSRLQMRRGKLASSLAAAVGLLGCAIGSSLIFFLVSNFAWWAAGDMYEYSLSGLVQCYVQAFVFFKYTLAGDLFYALLLFGSYAAALNLGWAAEPKPALAA